MNPPKPSPASDAFPEMGAGGYSRLDGTVEFFGRVNALLDPDMTVVDFGAGRGKTLADDPVEYRRRLTRLQGKVRGVIGIDIDPAVTEHPALDEAHVVAPDARLPLSDSSVDLIVADYVFEHIQDPAHTTGELDRILRPGGWICARTPSRWGLVSIATRLVPNALHVRVLRRVQPDRKAEDVFPTAFRLNTRGDLERWFDPARFEHHTYPYGGEPAYVGRSRVLFRLLAFVDRFLPAIMRPNLFVFIKKRA